MNKKQQGRFGCKTIEGFDGFITDGYDGIITNDVERESI